VSSFTAPTTPRPVPENNVSANNNHTARDKTENNTTIFYNHATQEIPTENGVSRFTAATTLKAVAENNVSTNNFLANDNHTARDKTETENNTTIFYNHATQEIPTEMMYQVLQPCYTGDSDGNDASSFTAATTLKVVAENNVSTNNFLTNDNHTARDKTETENNTTIFYNHATHEIPSENDVSSFTTMLHRRSRRK